MSNSGAFYLASNVGGKIEKTQVKSAVKKQVLSLSHLLLSHCRSGFVLFYDLLLNYIVLKCRYEKYHVGGDDEERKANYTDMVNKYYDLVTSFYEYGWGESFHFAPRRGPRSDRQCEPFESSIRDVSMEFWCGVPMLE
ncbi:hypothetical protein D5086_029079 [Populus alba]|uniref:Uncharacterized protein n=1 Tax=Populus alba TaxID=43335 RepID=A0ACC4ASF8_POPAL